MNVEKIELCKFNYRGIYLCDHSTNFVNIMVRKRALLIDEALNSV